MVGMLRARILLGGLALTLVAKAAISFPVGPGPEQAALDPTLAVRAAASGKDEKPQPEPEENLPPVVAGLDAGANADACEIPEEVLRSLTRERDLVAGQNAEINLRESELALAIEKLQHEKASLLELKGSIETLLAKVESQQTDDLTRLVDFYQAMKPVEAAQIMDDMDLEATIMIMGTMKPRNVAPILAKMSPIRARAISKIILERSQLPGDQDLIGIRLN